MIAHRYTLCMLLTTRVITGLWNVMLPGMSAAGQNTNVTSIHSSDSHAISNVNIFWIIIIWGHTDICGFTDIWECMDLGVYGGVQAYQGIQTYGDIRMYLPTNYI